MANRYWVGGDGTWNSTDTTHWSATSGGAGGASAPTSGDSAYFDASSGVAVVTLGETVTCNAVIATGFTGTLAFGSYEINVAGTTSCFTGTTSLTVTGTPVVNLTSSTSSGTRVISTGAVTEANSVTFNITAGTAAIQFQSSGRAKNLNFTGFKGTYNANNAITIYGNLTLDSGMTWASTTSTHTFGGSGVQTLTTNGVTIGSPVTINGTANTLSLADNCTIGDTRTVTLTNGTLDLNNNTLSCGLFSSSNSNTRTIAFGTGNITLTGSGATIWTTDNGTNLTITGTPVVNATYAGSTGTRALASSQTALGGTASTAISVNITAGSDTVQLNNNRVYNSIDFTGFSGTVTNNTLSIYGNLTFSSGMSLTGGTGVYTFASTTGTKTITTNGKTISFPITFNGVGGTWSFADALTQGSTRAFTITNGTVKLKSGATSTVGAFATSGSNQKYLQSTTAGSQATLSQASGTVTVSYLTIKDIAATGGATWNAYVDYNNVDQGGNTGWDFSYSPAIDNEFPVALRSFTQPKRF